MWYCKFLDLPEIPKNICESIFSNTSLTIIRDYKGWAHTRHGQEIVSANNPFYKVSDELEDWLRQNIVYEYNDVGLRYAHYESEKNTTGVHTDQTRKYVLQYLLSSGNGILNFWQEKGQDIIRSGRVTINNYDRLNLLESFNLPEKKWVLLNTNILHSVELLNSDRISVQISLNYEPLFQKT